MSALRQKRTSQHGVADQVRLGFLAEGSYWRSDGPEWAWRTETTLSSGVASPGVDWSSIGNDLILGGAVIIKLATVELTLPVMIGITATCLGAQIINWQNSKNQDLGGGQMYQP